MLEASEADTDDLLEGLDESSGGSDPIVRDRFRLLPEQPLPHLETSSARACAVSDLDGGSAHLYALICDPKVQQRLGVIAQLAKKPCPNLIAVQAFDVIRVGSELERRLVLIMDRPDGGRVLDHFPRGGVPESEIVKNILPPLLDALEGMASHAVTHRGIRADNIYYMDGAGGRVVLGECYGEPPARSQPAAYEPLDSAIADVDGRGDGSLASDAYALGVLVLHLLTGADPTAGRSVIKIAKDKMRFGSYGALVGETKLSQSMSYLLAGLLNDDPAKRWGIEKLQRWRKGIYDRPQPGLGDRRAPSALHFMGEDYHHPRPLALAFTEHPIEAVKLMKEGRFESWLRNSLGDAQSADRIRELLLETSERKGAKNFEARLIGRIYMVLDPRGPLCFRGLRIARRGLGTMIAAAYAKNDQGMKSALGELLSGTYLVEWMTREEETDRDWLPVYQISELQEHMRLAKFHGFGLERCLYELNPWIGCQSPVLEGAAVLGVGDLLSTLDIVAPKKQGERTLFDRHAAAFVATRGRGVDKFFSTLSKISSDGQGWMLKVLELLAGLQVAHGRSGLTGLVGWAVSAIRPLVEGVHSKERREKMQRLMEKLGKGGDLDDLISGMSLSQNLSDDARQYKSALQEFSRLNRRIAQIANGAREREFAAAEVGYWIASMVSFAALLASLGFGLAWALL